MTMARGTVRGLVPAVLAAVALAGCSSSTGAGDGSPGGPPVSGAPAKAAAGAGAEKTGADTAGAGAGATKVAERGGRVGGAGSACELPVTFDIAAHWRPRGVPVDLDPELAEELADLTEQGTVKMVCEIDAKPAGNIGFLRVWQGDPSEDDPRAVLAAFVADEPKASEVAYTQVTAGALAAAEVGYTGHSELLDEPKEERAFAVATPDGPVVVHLTGMDSAEHRAMLPAFELARKTLKLRR